MKSNLFAASALLPASLGLAGCAGVTFYSDASLTTKTGIPIYAPKPYLLVARTGATDKPVEVSVVYLNDPQKVIYADPHSGFGSANLTLALANGQMTSFGQQTDTKIPELIASLSGFITARAAAAKTEAEAAQIRAARGVTPLSPAEAGKRIVAVADEMLASISAKSLAELSAEEQGTVRSAAEELKAAGTALADPANAASAPALFDRVKQQIRALGALPGPGLAATRARGLGLVQTWVDQLSQTLAAAQPENQEPPAFELYEIVQGTAATSLRRITP